MKKIAVLHRTHGNGLHDAHRFDGGSQLAQGFRVKLLPRLERVPTDVFQRKFLDGRDYDFLFPNRITQQ